jgi:thermitase
VIKGKKLIILLIVVIALGFSYVFVSLPARPAAKNSLAADCQGDAAIADDTVAPAGLEINELRNEITDGKEVLVAVLDTGIEGSHEDLMGQVAGEVNFTDSDTANDVYGHGTHIAGIIAAKDNELGVTGIAPDCRLLNVKVANDRGQCDVGDLAAGIIWAVNNGAEVINISIEIKDPTPELSEAVAYAWENGALIIAAAGNSGSNEPVFPACYASTIAVAAVTQNERLAPLSNRGEWVDLAAPGYKIYSTFIDNSYDYESGTSFAAAHVSGIAALLFSIMKDTNGNGKINDEVKSIVEAGCRDIGITDIGAGYMDAARILTIINQPS